MLFDTQIAICERFNISPFQIRRERFSEFCLLIKRLKKHNAEGVNSGEKTKTKDGKERRYIAVTDYKEPKKGGVENG